MRRRRGLSAITAALTLGLVVISYAVLESLHLSNPAKNPLPGGTTKFGNAIFLLSMFGAIAAAIVGATAGSGDHDAGVYRDLVTTGRSRITLYLSRIPAGLAYLLPFAVGAYAILATTNAAFAGKHPAASPELLTLTGLWLLLEMELGVSQYPSGCSAASFSSSSLRPGAFWTTTGVGSGLCSASQAGYVKESSHDSNTR